MAPRLWQSRALLRRSEDDISATSWKPVRMKIADEEWDDDGQGLCVLTRLYLIPHRHPLQNFEIGFWHRSDKDADALEDNIAQNAILDARNEHVDGKSPTGLCGVSAKHACQRVL